MVLNIGILVSKKQMSLSTFFLTISTLLQLCSLLSGHILIAMVKVITVACERKIADSLACSLP